MKYYNGSGKKRAYFEGWYFKHQNNGDTICFIPGINIDQNGNKSAFIQVITNQASTSYSFPYDEFSARKDRLEIKIGRNEFSGKGMKIHLENNDFSFSGELSYNGLTPLGYDIMGPFCMLPFMECRHGVISLLHSLTGTITQNGEKIRLSGGTGYIETDFGCSFPKRYLWLQCNDFGERNCCVMVSVADIPYLGFVFKGCIAAVYIDNKEYRLSTYNGVKILEANEKKVVLAQNKYRLEVDIKPQSAKALFAPVNGDMTKTIHESPAVKADFRFFRDADLLFSASSDHASFEYV